MQPHCQIDKNTAHIWLKSYEKKAKMMCLQQKKIKKNKMLTIRQFEECEQIRWDEHQLKR